jgi:hypothetical protein
MAIENNRLGNQATRQSGNKAIRQQGNQATRRFRSVDVKDGDEVPGREN